MSKTKPYIKNITSEQADKILLLGDKLDFGARSTPSNEWLNSEIRRITGCSFSMAEQVIKLTKSQEQLYNVIVDDDLTKEQKRELKKLTENF